MTHLMVEALIGKAVVDSQGRHVGRIEDIRAERAGQDCVVRGYVVGASPLIERLHAWTLIRPIRPLIPHRWYMSYYVPWSVMDLTDPRAPRITVTRDELRRVPTR